MTPPSTALPAPGLPERKAEPDLPVAADETVAERRPTRLTFVVDEKKVAPPQQKGITPDWMAISEALLNEVGRDLASLGGSAGQ